MIEWTQVKHAHVLNHEPAKGHFLLMLTAASLLCLHAALFTVRNVNQPVISYISCAETLLTLFDLFKFHLAYFTILT